MLPALRVLAIASLLAFPSVCLAKGRQANPLPFFDYLKDPAAALICYSPTNHDPRPATRKVPSVESIRADLQVLRPAFDGLVLYGYDAELTPVILAEAVRQEYRAVVFGIWDPTSTKELAGTAKLIKKHQGTLTAACVIGNEGITFNRYKVDDLLTAAEILRALIGPKLDVPFATSEPLGGFDDPELQRLEGYSFIALNCHPVFDRRDLGPADAANWAKKQTEVISLVSGRHVLLKETGYPHGGKEQYTPASQKEFWAAYVAGERHKIVGDDERIVSYGAAFEAFDLPWKAEASGLPVEKNWGWFSPERNAYPAFEVWKTRQQASP